jgi:hypothetical protein
MTKRHEPRQPTELSTAERMITTGRAVVQGVPEKRAASTRLMKARATR